MWQRRINVAVEEISEGYVYEIIYSSSDVGKNYAFDIISYEWQERKWKEKLKHQT